MDVQIINPFLEATMDVFDSMVQVKTTVGKPTVKNHCIAQGEITGTIELLSAQHRGMLAISFSRPAALLIYEKMLGESASEVDTAVLDLIGEITNMVCGGAKNKLHKSGYDFELTQPLVLHGSDVEISHVLQRPILSIPFQAESNEIFIEVSMSD